MAAGKTLLTSKSSSSSQGNKYQETDRSEPADFVLEVAKQYDVSLLRYAGEIAFGVLASARVSFWLDDKNRTLFGGFNEDLSKMAFVSLTARLPLSTASSSSSTTSSMSCRHHHHYECHHHQQHRHHHLRHYVVIITVINIIIVIIVINVIMSSSSSTTSSSSSA